MTDKQITITPIGGGKYRKRQSNIEFFALWRCSSYWFCILALLP